MSFELVTNTTEIMARREKIEKEILLFRNKVIEKFKDSDALKIQEALDFMLEIHLPQPDRFDGRLFASHPLAVAERVMEVSDDPELVIAALIHDSVEDQRERIFLERMNRKYPNRTGVQINIDDKLKKKHQEIFKSWSFREIKDRFGDQVCAYVESITNYNYNDLADDLNLSGEDKQDFINKLYSEHVEQIISDPKLLILKLADLTVNSDLKSLSPNSEKFQKLKKKYKPVIKMMIQKLLTVDNNHLIYSNKNKFIADLSAIYLEQYDGEATDLSAISSVEQN
jgi:(p)ppGpp synthase/HD superfamily hydrolase